MKIVYSELPIDLDKLPTYVNKQDIIFDASKPAIYAKGTEFSGTKYQQFAKATQESSQGYNGLVPAPNYNDGSDNRFLREDGSWQTVDNATKVNGYTIAVVKSDDEMNNEDTIYFVI